MAAVVETRQAGRSAARSAGRAAGVALTYVVLLFLGLMFSFPFLWTLSSSLKTAHETQVFPPGLLPAVPQWVEVPPGRSHSPSVQACPNPCDRRYRQETGLGGRCARSRSPPQSAESRECPLAHLDEGTR